MHSIAQNLKNLKTNIAETAKKYNRTPSSITLVAVTKTHSATKIAECFTLGQRHFAENYVREALAKKKEFNDPKIIWHYIGRIQSNKTKPLARHFSWVQSVTTKGIAELLDKHRPDNLPPLNICLQVNLSNEASKAGASIYDIVPLAVEINKLPRLKLRGLMAIPAPTDNFATQVKTFRILSTEFKKLNTEYSLNMDTLSMGMSYDYQAAIAAGATMLRIGSAIFGPRDYTKTRENQG